MSRELDMLAKQYQKEKATVIRKDISLFRTSITTAAAGFLREVERQCTKEKQANFILVAIISHPARLNSEHTANSI